MVVDLVEKVSSTDEHVRIYLGNAQPGILVTEIRALRTLVDAHEKYINERTAIDANADKSTSSLWTRVGILAALISSAVALFKVFA